MGYTCGQGVSCRLKAFEVATTFLSYEENTTISVILPVIFSLVEGLDDNSKDSAFLKHAVEEHNQS